MTASQHAVVVSVFPSGAGGGNPAPIVLDADGMSDDAMLATARAHALESGFVLAPESADADFRLRFFVPRHEMEMCGHATIAALWLMRDRGRIGPGAFSIETLSGRVRAEVPAGAARIAITQPRGEVTEIHGDRADAIRDVLGIEPGECLDVPIVNARTSRTKTMVGIASPKQLHALQPDFARVEAFCADIDSTGLYPYAVNAGEANLYHARQFPRASGYPEDAATGIAATALAFGLWHCGLVGDARAPLRIRQGEAMGRPSEITVSFEFDGADDTPARCWLSGTCDILEDERQTPQA